uniref:Uncharacterized protein n=1 Tax=Arundo donax TaxID=35708 RepID=A0A0A9TZQ3_ARUDO
MKIRNGTVANFQPSWFKNGTIIFFNFLYYF